MRRLVTILVMLGALGCIAYTSGASVLHLSNDVGEMDTYINPQTKPLPNNRFGARARRGGKFARSLALVFQISLAAAFVFLVVRCAAYISAVSQFTNSNRRRLAQGGECDPEVRKLRASSRSSGIYFFQDGGLPYLENYGHFSFVADRGEHQPRVIFICDVTEMLLELSGH